MEFIQTLIFFFYNRRDEGQLHCGTITSRSRDGICRGETPEALADGRISEQKSLLQLDELKMINAREKNFYHNRSLMCLSYWVVRQNMELSVSPLLTPLLTRPVESAGASQAK